MAPLPGNRSAHLPPLVRAMLRPAFYPHRPAAVRLVQTHISWVFLAGERVYKVKKTVDFGFLDFSTPGKRARGSPRGCTWGSCRSTRSPSFPLCQRGMRRKGIPSPLPAT